MADRRCVASFLTVIAKPFGCKTNRLDFTCESPLWRDCMLDLNRLALILQKRISYAVFCLKKKSNFAKDGTCRSLEPKVPAQLFGQQRYDHPIGQRLMHWLDRLANALHE